MGEDPRQRCPATAPTAGIAASLVYRAFMRPDPGAADAPNAPATYRPSGKARLSRMRLLFVHAQERPRPGPGASSGLGSHRYGIVHLGGRDDRELRQRTIRASTLLGWPAPYADLRHAPAPLPSLGKPQSGAHILPTPVIGDMP